MVFGAVTNAQRPTRLRAAAIAGVVVVPIALIGLYRASTAAHAATQAKASLERAETNLASSRLDDARTDLEQAKAQFKRVRREIRALGPLLPVAGAIPFVRVQVRGANAFADAGQLLSDAGLRLTETAESVLHPADPNVQVADALEPLRTIQVSLDASTQLLDAATAKVGALDGYRLIGPLGKARNELVRRLPRIEERAASARDDLSAMVAFTGGDGPRRYLFLSQNPAEIRPTGGYIGTYGVVSARGGRLSLERYDSIESWTETHPQASITPEAAGSPFPFILPPSRQSLANVNAVPDWPRVAQAATDMWQRGGEAPVNGVVSISTGFLVRLLGVLGPAAIEGYGETVTAENVVERIDFYVRRPAANRKDFVAAVAEAMLQRLIAATAPRWPALMAALGQGFDSREVMAWSADTAVSTTLVERGWDGALPESRGDFFFDSHFAFGTKNSRGLKRTYDHDVALRADGSALVTTTITIENTQPRAPLNTDSLGFVTVYGPTGGTLDRTSDPPATIEPSLADHPAAGYFRAALPLNRSTLKVAFNVPKLLDRQEDGTWAYNLLWRRIPDHTGDVANLHIELPPGWRWRGPAPPASIDMTNDVRHTWTLATGGRS